MSQEVSPPQRHRDSIFRESRAKLTIPNLSLGDPKCNTIGAFGFTSQGASCIVIGIRIGKWFGSLKDFCIIDWPFRRIAHIARRVSSSTTVLIRMKDIAGGITGNFIATGILYLKDCRAGIEHILRAACRGATICLNSVRLLSSIAIDIHRKIGTINQADIIEIETGIRVEIKLSEGCGHSAPGLAALKLSRAIARFALPMATAIE